MPDSRRLRVWRIRLLMFLAVIGPGFITANVDNDAGGEMRQCQDDLLMSDQWHGRSRALEENNYISACWMD